MGDRRRRGPEGRNWTARDRREAEAGFRCANKACRAEVPVNPYIGTQNRNHCPFCLASRHVDERKPGDRRSECWSTMPPVGLAFKAEGNDKWGRPVQGELMVVHRCPVDGKVSINRLAADDQPDVVEALLDAARDLDDAVRHDIEEAEIVLATEADRDEVRRQLGRS